ncbi:MAG: ABC transporter substrate-binding protein [Vulcanimicrobiaceae bacterium]
MIARRRFLVGLSSASALCTSARIARGAGAPSGVTIVYQFGYAYAPLIVMKQQRVLEREFPGTSFSWHTLASGSAIRDGMIANQVQIGAGGVAPFLIGWDRGVGWKLLGSLCDIDMWLVTRDPSIKSLKDLKPGMKIGMPAPDSIQAIVLRKAAQEQLGNAHALDADIVAMPHPAGLAALKAGQIVAHFTNPPFQFEEVADGGHVVLRSFDIFGTSTLDSVFATESFAHDYPEFVTAFYTELKRAVELINREPANAAAILSEDGGGKIPAASYKDWLSRRGTTFTITPHGYLKYAKFMHDIGLIAKMPASVADLELPTLSSSGN